MRHLENAFKFTFKNFLLTLPYLISLAIPALIVGVGSLGLLGGSAEFINAFQEMMGDVANGNSTFDFSRLLESLNIKAFIASSAISVVISLVLNIIIMPATYGLVNLQYETGNAKLNDLSHCISKYIGRYILYGLLYLAFLIGSAIAAFFLMLFGIFISTIIEPLGFILVFLILIAYIVALIAMSVYLMLWFPAVCVEDCGVIDGLKSSFRTVRGSFWPILGITLLINICGGITNIIIGGILSWVPILSNMVGPIILGLADFILLVYYFDIYREKTGRFNYIEPSQQFNGFQDGSVQ